jgi:hypothetical protein
MQINFNLKLCITAYYKYNKIQTLPSFQTNFLYSMCRKMLYTKNHVRILSQPVFENYEIRLTCTVMRPHVPQLKTALVLPYHIDTLKNLKHHCYH